MHPKGCIFISPSKGKKQAEKSFKSCHNNETSSFKLVSFLETIGFIERNHWFH